MTQIDPFCAVAYDPSRVPFQDVVALPYDKIDEAARAVYLENSPYSVVRLSMPGAEGGEDPYASAAHTYRSWREEGVLRFDEQPALHPYHQLFEIQGQGQTRRGFVARVRLEEPGVGQVLFHEQTFEGPIADRLALLSAMGVHLGQIFLLYDDPEGVVQGLLDEAHEGAPPRMQVIEEGGVVHRLWTVEDREIHRAIARFFQVRALTLADGHHRYTTAWRYHQQGGGPDHVMATLVAFQDPGLVLLPSHRLVLTSQVPSIEILRDRLNDLFEFRPHPFVDEPSRQRARTELEEDVRIESYRTPSFGFHRQGDDCYWLLRLRDRTEAIRRISDRRSDTWKGLAVVILHRLLLEQGIGLSPEEIDSGGTVGFVRHPREAYAAIESGEATACLLTSGTRLDEMQELAGRGELMPQQSTDFFPKLLTGLVLDEFDSLEENLEKRPDV